jgi:predicted  nucleic acid-binding Zn-ribbon protein
MDQLNQKEDENEALQKEIAEIKEINLKHDNKIKELNQKLQEAESEVDNLTSKLTHSEQTLA